MVSTRPSIPRRLNLADMTILVLATAVGMMAIRHDLQGLFARPQSLENGRWVSRWSLPVALSKAVVVETWLMAWTAGWLVLQLRSPRPRLRQLARQPGFLACLSTAVVTLVSGTLTLACIASSTSGNNVWLDRMVWGEWVSVQIGSAVLAGWTLLAVSGLGRVRSGWLDRVGQLIGLVWVTMLPANLVHFFWYSGWTN
jgi:hypothetical protein